MPASDYIRSIREKVGHAPLLLPSVGAYIFDEFGRVLLHRSSDDGKWHTIGGMIEPGEEPAIALVREVKEETDLDVQPDRVCGVYAWPESRYTNGDICYYIAITFRCSIIKGTAKINDDESLDLQFFDLDSLPELLDLEVKAIHDARAVEAPTQFILPSSQSRHEEVVLSP